MKIDFDKFSGAKNIFLICEKMSLSEVTLKKIITTVCDPYQGFFADGVVFIEAVGSDEFKWYFYNSDGSSAEMCGNAIRCAHGFIKKKNPDLNKVVIQTLSGKVTSEYKEGLFFVQMPFPKHAKELELTENFFATRDEFDTFKKMALSSAYFVDTGVPHLVIDVYDWEEALTMTATWLFLRRHPHFVNGTNVTLIQSKSPMQIKAISFERGVDGFTQACGTGAVAAAIYAGYKQNQKQISVFMPGGILNVDLSKENPVLSGQAIDVGHVSTEIKE